MYAARVAWLAGAPLWQEDGRILFRTPVPDNGGSMMVAPTAEALARAQYCLYRIAAHPYSAAVALGADPDQWLAERQTRLEVAKRIGALGECVLSAPTDPSALAALLLPEALHEGSKEPPFSPAQLLARLGRAAVAPLNGLLKTPGLPAVARILAALTLGATLRRAELAGDGVDHTVRECATGAPVALQAALQWGRREGLPPKPSLLAAFLAAGLEQPERDVSSWLEMAGRFVAARAAAQRSRFAVPTTLLRALLHREADPESIVQLCEAVATEAVPLEPLLRRRRHELPQRPWMETAEMAEEARGVRVSLARQAARLLWANLRCASNGGERLDMVRHFAHYVCGVLTDEPSLLTPHLERTLLWPLSACLEQPRSASSALRFLAEERVWLWGEMPETRPLWERQPGWLTERLQAARRRTAGLEERWGSHVRPALLLVRRSGGATELVQKALKQLEPGAWPCLRRWEMDDSEACRWCLRWLASADFGPLVDWRFCYLIQEVAKAGKRVRADFSALISDLRSRPAEVRAGIIGALRDEIGVDGKQRKAETVAAARRTAPLLASIATRQESFTESYLMGVLLRIAVATVKAQALLSRMLRLAESAPVVEKTRQNYYSTGKALWQSFAVTRAVLGTDTADEERFEKVAGAVLNHLLRTETMSEWSVERGLRRLPEFTGLCELMADLLPLQTRRCLDLLTGIGNTDFLGSDGAALAPLALLEPGGIGEAFCAANDPEWAAVLELAPDLAPLVGAYWYARWLRGLPQQVPAGIQKAALGHTDKLTHELAYLQERGEATPGAGITKRIENLRARLADAERLREQAAAESRERLRICMREEQIAAAEQQLQECYRARCAILVGRPLGPNVVFDDDLRNATLIAAQIETNRKLLVNLLRAWAEGGAEAARRFIAERPENQAFLERLAESGKNAQVWQGEHPGTVRLPISGMWVCLRLERNPLRVLQMGNPFGTCLSAGGFNAFSTVANASEANKRVLFAYDQKTGRIIGRKLIGLTEEGKLLGFYTYTAVDGESDRAALADAIRGYLLDFAARCGLETVGEGTIPRLFAEDWYDDGARPWSESYEVAAGEAEPSAPLPEGHLLVAQMPPRSRAMPPPISSSAKLTATTVAAAGRSQTKDR